MPTFVELSGGSNEFKLNHVGRTVLNGSKFRITIDTKEDGHMRVSLSYPVPGSYEERCMAMNDTYELEGDPSVLPEGYKIRRFYLEDEEGNPLGPGLGE